MNSIHSEAGVVYWSRSHCVLRSSFALGSHRDQYCWHNANNGTISSWFNNIMLSQYWANNSIGKISPLHVTLFYMQSLSFPVQQVLTDRNRKIEQETWYYIDILLSDMKRYGFSDIIMILLLYYETSVSFWLPGVPCSKIINFLTSPVIIFPVTHFSHNILITDNYWSKSTILVILLQYQYQCHNILLICFCCFCFCSPVWAIMKSLRRYIVIYTMWYYRYIFQL